jgi:hypothetical protein
MIPSEPLDMIDLVAADYLQRNPDVAEYRRTDAQVAIAWHMTTELAAEADAVLRTWRVPHAQRRQMASHLLEQAFGTPAGRVGAEMAAQLAEAERRDRDRQQFMEVLLRPAATEVEVLGQRFRYEDRQWIEVDTPAYGA